MAATRTIVAVAIGNSQKNTVIRDSSPATLKGLRPYIKGLISWLANEPDPPVPDSVLGRYQIGDANDYVIDYRECTEDDLKHNYDFKPKNGLPSSYVILCMSTTVAREAVNFSTAIPIVAIVSDPFKENFPENVCGVSARRPDHAKDCYNIFKAKIAPTKIYLLHKDGYGPSEISRKWIGKRDCLSIKNNDVLKDKIGTIPPGSGLRILPADRFFGAADDIIQWAEVDNNISTFWTVTDWVKAGGAFGGYGFSQETCGQYMAERVAQIWTSNGNIPDPPFVRVHDKWVDGPKYRPAAKPLKAKRKKGKAKKAKRA